MATDRDDGTRELLESLDALQATVDGVKRDHPFDGPVYRSAAIVDDALGIARAAAIQHCEACARLNEASDVLVRMLATAAPPPETLQ